MRLSAASEMNEHNKIIQRKHLASVYKQTEALKEGADVRNTQPRAKRIVERAKLTRKKNKKI